MRKFLIPIALILIGLLFSSVYIVQEGNKGIVLRFHNFMALSEPGLHFRIPGMDKVRIIDAKVQTFDSAKSSIGQKFISKDQTQFMINYFVKWKVTNFERYYTTIANGNKIEDLLISKLNNQLNNEFSKLDIKDIVNNSNYELKSKNAFLSKMKDVLNDTSTNTDFGVEVLDIGIIQINFPAEASKSIYDHMNQQFQVFAQDKRFKALNDVEKIMTNSRLEAIKIISDAEKQASRIKGESDAKVTKIYSEIVSKEDIEFFNFIRSLRAYDKILQENGVLGINSDSEFFHYMNQNVNINSDNKLHQ